MKPGLLLLWVLCAPTNVQVQASVEVAVIDREGGSVTDLQAGVPFGLRVNGSSLTPDDRVRVVPSSVQCGSAGADQSAAELLVVPLAGRVAGQDFLATNGTVGPLNNASIEQEWSGLVLASAGQYRICHCLAASPPCDSAAKFQTQLGLLQVLGPATGHAFRCTVGWPCEAGPLTGNVAAGNQLRLMTSCNPPVGAGGFLPGSEQYANATDGLASDPMVSDALLSSGGTFSWGSSAVQGLGRSYEVCWCAGGQSSNCTQSEDFLVSVGTLEVPGPSRLVDILCSTGRQCQFSLPTQYSVGLGDGDRVLASQGDCGADAAPIVGWPNEGVSDAAAGSGQHFEWSSSAPANSTLLNGTFAAQPGVYRLCWCHRDTPCVNSSDFRMHIGSLAFAGPSGGQSWVCTRGQQCTLPDIQGTMLSVGDRYLVQSACGSQRSEEGFEGGSALPTDVQPSPSLNGTAAAVTWSRVMTVVGEYQLCWAAPWQRPSNRSCSELSWDSQSSGLPSVCANTSLGDGRCDLLSAADASLRCDALGARLCLPHELTQGEAAGTPCTSSSARFWTGQRCGSSHRAAVVPDQGAGSLSCQAESVAVSQFLSEPATMSWACCADQPATLHASIAAYFSQPPVFAAGAGLVTVRGPHAQDASCVSGEACNVRLRGLLLNSTLDRLLILKYAESCGNASASLAAADFQQVLANGTSDTTGSVTFTLGTASTFATFHMCWCSMVHSSCVNVQDFNVFVGDLLVGGIDRQTTYCIYSLPCTIELRGTNLGQADSILISPVGEQCGGRLSSVPEVEVNPATMMQRVNTTAKAFAVGVISRLDAFQVCYCINFGNRACTSGGAPVFEAFSMAAGVIEVRGPNLNTTLTPARMGVPYRLQLTGRLLNRFNRITVLRAGGPSCGTFGSNESDPSVMISTPLPVSVYTDGTQEGWDVTVMRSGDFFVCWCNADPCNNATSYGVLAASFTVDGLLDDRPPYYPPQIVGNPFPLLLQGQNLRSSDRLVIAPRTSVASCGASETNRYGTLSQNVEGRAPTVIGSADSQVTSQLWLNARVADVGGYLICWCGRTLCTLGSHFNIEAARINITGPTHGDFPAVTAGEPFRLSVAGTALTMSDRISIVDMGTECGTLPVSSLASTVVDSTGTGEIGAPLHTSDSVTTWGGLRIRWQGLYKVCWAGNYSFSRLCLATDASGQCNQFESAYYPYHVGNLRVDYGNISLAGPSRIVRCGTLDVMAVPPQFTPRLTLDYAEWRCEPRESEICESLHFDFLDVRARGHLSLNIPADTISSGLDRARFWASGRGEDSSVHNISLSITMIDIENITRRGSMAMQIFAQAPLVVGSPLQASISTEDQLFLAVYVKLPGGDFCDSVPTMPSGVTVSWSLQPGGDDLSTNNTASSPYHLLMEPMSVADLGIGTHSILARISFGGTYPSKDVAFQVTVRENRLLPPTLVAPDAVPDGCPVPFAAGPPPGLESSLDLAYGWTCAGPQGAPCSGFPSGGGFEPVRVFDLSASASTPGLHSVSLRVEESDGGTAEAQVSISVLPGSLPGGGWPVAILPMPEALGAAEPITCAAASLSGNQSFPARCAPPADAAWSLVNLTDYNISVDDVLTEEDLYLMNSTELSLDTQRVPLSADGYPAVTITGIVPVSMLQAGAGGRYRCVLRAGDTILGSTSNFLVGSAPRLGWITVAPRSGTALQTQFTLESSGWLSEHLPLRHAFLAVPGPAAPPPGGAVDAARFLRGFGAETGATVVLGVTGRQVTVVVRVRDILGSSAQASSEIEVTPAAGVTAALAALGSAWWPPDPRVALATAAAMVLAISPDPGFADPLNATVRPARGQAAATAAVVAALLDALRAAAGPTLGGGLSREDLGLEVWVLERTLQLAFADAGIASALNATSSLNAAAVLLRAATRSAAAPPEAPTARRFVAVASLLVTAGVASLQEADAVQVLSSVHSAAQHLGNALYAGVRQGAAPGGPYLASALALERTAASNMSLTVGWADASTAAAGLNVPAEGLQLRLPALVRRRLSTAAAVPTCAGGDVRVQLTRWPRSPVSPPPLALRVLFEGPLDGLRMATLAEAGGEEEIAGLRLWGCPATAWQSAAVIVTFSPEAGVAGRSFEVDIRNGSEIQTSRVDVSWVCAQWDRVGGLWRAQQAMTALNNGTIACTSQLNVDVDSAALAEASADGYIFLAALPAARSTWLRSVPAEPPAPVPPRELFWSRLWGLGIAVLVGQTLLLGLFAFTKPLEVQAEDTCRAAEEAHALARRPTLSSKSAQTGLGAQAPRHYCVLVPALWLLDGLWQIAPWRLLSWSSLSCKRRRGSIDMLEGFAGFATGLMEKSIPTAILTDSEQSLKAEPGLRDVALQRAKEAIANAEKVQEDKLVVSGLGLERRYCGSLIFDAREQYFRGLLMRAMDMYRDLKAYADQALQADRLKSIRSTPKRHSDESITFFERRLPTDPIQAEQEEALSYAIAHHVQQEIVTMALGKEKVMLTNNERDTLSSYQDALRKAMGRKAPLEKPLLMSAYSPPIAVPVQLLSIDSGIDHHSSKPGSGVKPLSRAGSKQASRQGSAKSTPGGSRQGSAKRISVKSGRTASAGKSREFAGVLPQQPGAPKHPAARPGHDPASELHRKPTWEDDPAYAAMKAEMDMEEQPFIPGATYFMWVHGRSLHIHRSASTLHDAKEKPQAVDYMLSIHEVTRAYALGIDLQEFSCSASDDRTLVMRLRKGPRLRWRVAGEARSWASTPQYIEGGGCKDLNEVVHGDTGSVLQNESSSIFRYKLRQAPHTSNSVHLETVEGLAAHVYMWYSHGGSVVSFALAPGDASASKKEDPPLPGVLDETGSHQELAQAVGFYTSDIISVEHILRPITDVARSSYYQTVLTLLDGRRFRLCFATRFARLACQTSMISMRELVFPDAPPIIIRGHGSMASTVKALPKIDDSPSRPEPKVNPAYDPPQDEPERWQGLCGCLELRILSASKLGLTEPKCDKAILAADAFGGVARRAPPKPRGRTGMPSPRVFAYIHTQPPPAAPECRKTVDLPERTSDPIWNLTWNFTAEFSEADSPPADIRLEVWDCAGTSEFLGEVVVPFPRGNRVRQYHMPLRPHYSKMATGETRQVNGTISFQLRWRAAGEVEPVTTELLPIPPAPLFSVCGTLGITLIRGVDLRSADFLSSDPYCVVHVSTAPKIVSSWRTETQFSTRNPVWDEVHEFNINWPVVDFGSAPVVKVELWDYDHYSTDEFLGEASFPLPSNEGYDVLELELVPNRSKGAATVKGHVHVRLYYNGEFHHTEAGLDNDLSPYEQTYCSYFGTRPVDDQLARAMAPSLVFFHFSFSHLLRGQFRRAWHMATCGLVDPARHRAGGAQARINGYFALSASLWSEFALTAMALAEWSSASHAVAITVGALVAAFLPDPAHVLAQVVWNNPSPPRSVGVEAWSSRGEGDHPIFAVIVYVAALFGLAFSLVLGDQDADLRIALGALSVLVVRLLVLPFLHGLSVTVALSWFKRSHWFDWIVRYSPSMLTAHTAAL